MDAVAQVVRLLAARTQRSSIRLRPVITSREDAILAVNAGLRNGAFYVECVSMTRRVNIPTAVARVQASRLFSGGLSMKATILKPASSAT